MQTSTTITWGATSKHDYFANRCKNSYELSDCMNSNSKLLKQGVAGKKQQAQGSELCGSTKERVSCKFNFVCPRNAILCRLHPHHVQHSTQIMQMHTTTERSAKQVARFTRSTSCKLAAPTCPATSNTSYNSRQRVQRKDRETPCTRSKT